MELKNIFTLQGNVFPLFLFYSICTLIGWSDQCFQSGECRDSLTVGVSITTDEFACLDLCKENLECKWFTFFTLTNLCLLFEDCQVLDEEICPECLSGQHFCIPDEPVCNVQGFCSGVLDQFEELPSLETCLQLCQSSFGCRWITFVQTTLECLLYKTCPELDESCDGCFSSERRCIDDVTTTTDDISTTEVETTTTTTTDYSTPSPTGKFKKLNTHYQCQYFNVVI